MAKSYEESIKELETIIRKLEGDDTPLDEAIKLFEQSQKLVAACEKELQGAEKKLKTLVKGKSSGSSEDGQLELV